MFIIQKGVATMNNTELNIIERLILAYPYEKWIWVDLIENQTVSLEFIVSHRRISSKWYKFWKKDVIPAWNWHIICTCVTEDIIDKYPDAPWIWYDIFHRNSNISIDFINKHQDKEIYDPQQAWNHSNTTIDFENIQFDNLLMLNAVCKSSNLTIEFIKANLDKNLNWCLISTNPAMTSKTIIDNPHLPWVWICLHDNPNLTIELVSTFRDKKLYWSDISKHPNITIDDIIQHPDYPWNITSLSENYTLTLDYVNNHPSALWNWYAISANPNITMDIIEMNFNKPWRWDGISENPNLTIEFIQKYGINKFCIEQIGINKFHKHPYFDKQCVILM
jgi:hypothetical protein